MLNFIASGIGYVILSVLGLLTIFGICVNLVEWLGSFSFLKLSDYNTKLPSEVQDLRNRIIVLEHQLSKGKNKK